MTSYPDVIVDQSSPDVIVDQSSPIPVGYSDDKNSGSLFDFSELSQGACFDPSRYYNSEDEVMAGIARVMEVYVMVRPF